jgi:cellulose synthase/poly-beta-1,6-N-acetylglucosamine synthase-like glycosyltransferase
VCSSDLKTSAVNLAVEIAKGEILFFSDANSIFSPDVLAQIIRNFSDPNVGYVTGKMIYRNSDGSIVGDGCSAYMKYENLLRKLETSIGSIVGVDGGLDAIRKNLYLPMSPDQLPDFVLPLKVVKQGYRVVYEPDAVLMEDALNSSNDEYRMRVRVALRAFWALSDLKEMLQFRENPLFAWQLWSHKVLRYICFTFLISSYVTNIILLEAGFGYQLLFGLQTAAYVGAFISPIAERKGYNFSVLRFCYYFILINAACAHAFLKFILRQKMVIWSPRKG